MFSPESLTTDRRLPSISVVIPCHNYGRFLGEALHSVMGQTLLPQEVIVVDDGSSDETPDVLADLRSAPSNLISLRNEHPQGVVRAVRDGIEASSGAFLMRLDADDYLSPTYVEDLATVLAVSHADVAYAGEQFVGAAQGYRPPRPFSAPALATQNFINASAMCRRWVWERTGGYHTGFDRLGLEDWELWVHALRLGATFVPVESCRLYYRRHENGSRNLLSHGNDLRAHIRVWKLHRGTVRSTHFASWLVTSGLRKARRLGRRANPARP